MVILGRNRRGSHLYLRRVPLSPSTALAFLRFRDCVCSYFVTALHALCQRPPGLGEGRSHSEARAGTWPGRPRTGSRKPPVPTVPEPRGLPTEDAVPGTWILFFCCFSQQSSNKMSYKYRGECVHSFENKACC